MDNLYVIERVERDTDGPQWLVLSGWPAGIEDRPENFTSRGRNYVELSERGLRELKENAEASRLRRRAQERRARRGYC